MLLMHDELARARTECRLRRSERARPAALLARARRAERRAGRATRKANRERALARAVLARAANLGLTDN